jgi:uncharacterized protein
MKEHITQLGDLQELEVMMRRLEKEHGELVKAEDTRQLFTRLNDLQMRLEKLGKENERISMQYHRAETMLEPLQAQKKQMQTLLYGGTVHNEKEMAQIQTRIQQIAGQIDKAEGAIVDLMQTQENLERVCVETQNENNTLKAQLMVKRKENAEAIIRLTSQIKEMDEMRLRLRSSIDTQILAVYDKLRTQKGTAVARLQGEICTGCRVGVPSHMLRKVKEGQALVYCETCGRLLIPTEKSI